MYCDFYQLTERPFNVTPDPKFLYLNARYREALASLSYGITQRKGFITLIGEAGTGKTTLLKKLLEDLDPKTKTVFIFNTNVTFEEILEYILAEFDLPVHNGKKLYMLQRLNTFLLEELRGAGNVALLIDEAQDLEFSVLEDLRLLSNLETAKEKILQIVLSGQPELGQKLSNPVLRQLRQRIGINCRLLPLSRDEITEYVQYRLQAAQCPDLKLFTREAEDQIYHFSRGIPRLVNVVCDNALVIGYALGKKRISDDIIREAAADLLSLEPKAEETREGVPSPAPIVATTPKASRPNARLGVIAVFVGALVIGMLSVGRTMLTRPGVAPAIPPPPVSFEVIQPGMNPRGSGIDNPAEPVARPPASSVTALDAGIPRPVEEMPAAVAKSRPAAEPPPAIVEVPQPEVVRAAPAPTAVPEHLPAREIETSPPSRAGAPAMAAHDVDAAVESAVRAAQERNVEAVAPAIVPPTMPRQPERVAALAPHLAVPEVAPVAAKPAAAPRAAEPAAPVVPAPSRVPVRPTPEKVRAETQPDEPVEEIEAPVMAVKKVETPRVAALRPTPPAEEPAGEVEAEALPASGGGDLDGVSFANQEVRVGDSVSGIAMRKYGQASYTVLDLLKLANPEVEDIDSISVGQKIRLPELGEGYPVLKERGGKYSLLVVSSPSPGKAKELQTALRSRGFDARVTNTSVGSGKPLYRVVVGGYGGRDKVAAAGKQIQRLFRENASLAELAE